MTMNRKTWRRQQVRQRIRNAPLALDDAIDVDLFAGGGGASTGLETGLNRLIRLAINHNPKALSMHQANHPHAFHITEDIWKVDPHLALAGRPIGWLHASPDCTHHSQAAAGQPRKQEIRSLAWIIPYWAAIGQAVVISMENVKQMMCWGPLIAKRDKATGRVIKLVEVMAKGKTKVVRVVAEPGERVPRHQQYLVPDRKRQGQTWRQFIEILRGFGYQVDYKCLNAADYGAATKRERLYMICRRDGHAIIWPVPSHGKDPSPASILQPHKMTADHIDWNRPCPSIFMTKEEAKAQGLNVKRPLADATLERLATGLVREVLNNPQPFIVEIANWSRAGIHPVDQPLRTITAWPKGGSFALAAPVMVQANGGFNTVPCRPVTDPCSTITASGSQQQLVEAFMVHLRRNMDASPLSGPMPVITARSQHHALVETHMAEQGEYALTPEQEADALRVSAFLMRYYSQGGQWGKLTEPMHTITTKERLALVTVTWQGSTWVIVDIGLRMLTPAELYGCQGFPQDYIFDRGHDGQPLTVTDQVLMVGNSVSPPPMAALARANNPYKLRHMREAA